MADKDNNFEGNDNFTIFTRDYLMTENLERRIYERPLHLRVNLLSRIKANLFQTYLYINLL